MYTAWNLPFHCLLVWDSYDTDIFDKWVHLFSFAKLFNKASSLLKQLQAASMRPMNKSLFAKQTKFLWDTTKQNWTSQIACPFSLRDGNRTTTGERPQPGTKPVVSEASDSYTSDVTAGRCQAHTFSRWPFSADFHASELSKGTEKKVIAQHFCNCTSEPS